MKCCFCKEQLNGSIMRFWNEPYSDLVICENCIRDLVKRMVNLTYILEEAHKTNTATK